MKINDKFELASNGNPFDSILSLLTETILFWIRCWKFKFSK